MAAFSGAPWRQRARRRLAQALDGPAVRQSREQQLRGDAVEIGPVLGELPRGAAVQVGAHGRRDIAVDRGAHDRVYERQALDALGDRRAGERAGRGRGRGRLEPRQASRLAERRAVAEDRERAGELGRAGTQRDQPAQQQPRDALGSELADVGAGPALGELARQRVQVVRVAARGVETLLNERGVRRRAEPRADQRAGAGQAERAGTQGLGAEREVRQQGTVGPRLGRAQRAAGQQAHAVHTPREEPEEAQ